MTARMEGGERIDAFVRMAYRFRRMEIEVGFINTDVYDDGTRVADVAMWNEFGTADAPQRPFFRSAIHAAKPQVEQMIRKRALRRLLRRRSRRIGLDLSLIHI